MTFGFDYGCKPILIVPGDFDFINLLNDGFLALGYGDIPEYGLLIDVPLLVMLFENEDVARECFLHFKSWGSGDAIRISFIELNNGGFLMCTSQDMNHLLEQSIPERFREEFEARIFVLVHPKEFPNPSEGLKWFRSRTLLSPFVLVPQTVNGQPMRELAIQKREVNFFTENEITDSFIEYSVVKNRNSSQMPEFHREIPSEMRYSATEIFVRRMNQLRRFFPVTIERLTLNKTFNQIKQSLIEEGFREWQILQAGCNLVLKQAEPELFKVNTESTEQQLKELETKVLIFLIDNYETLSSPTFSEDIIDITKIKEQIYADSFTLLRYVLDKDVPDDDLSYSQHELAVQSLLDK
ncbi:MAG: hypothetical protein WA584_11550 [Pyrinomonadaceae bacterium]